MPELPPFPQHPFEVFKEATGFELDVERLRWMRGVREILSLHALRYERKLESRDADKVFDILEAIVALQLRASDGDERAHDRLTAIAMIAETDVYDILFTKIRELIVHPESHTNQSLARGWELCTYIRDVSFVLEPPPEEISQLTGLALVKVIAVPAKLCHRGLSDIDDLYARVKARLRPQSTLLSLAIALYLEDLRQDGINRLTVRTLKGDLKKSQKWAEAEPDNSRIRTIEVHGGGQLYVHKSGWSYGWQLRKRDRIWGRPRKGIGGKRVEKNGSGHKGSATSTRERL